MRQHALQQIIVIVYLAVTAAAFVFTMTRISLLPLWVTRWSYGMMAPYQGYVSWNDDFLYEGLRPDGEWERIDIDRYLPHGFGERNVRKSLRVYAEADRRRKFTEFALSLLAHERARGRDYRAVRVFFDHWDRSPAGFEFLHTPLFTEREPLTNVQ